jgi:hypothetical protein
MLAKLDPYELIAVIPTGVIFCIGLFLIFFGLPMNLLGEADNLNKLNASLGDLGLIVIVAFVAGQLLRQIARRLERWLWPLFGGWPAERYLDRKRQHLDHGQYERLYGAIDSRILHRPPTRKDLNGSLVHDMFVQCHAANRAERLDAMNRNYGFFNGLAVSFLLLAIVAAFQGLGELEFALVLFAVGLLAVYATVEAGNDFAMELMTQFINLPPPNAKSDDDKKDVPVANSPKVTVIVEE